jgi:hypothetical protein
MKKKKRKRVLRCEFWTPSPPPLRSMEQVCPEPVAEVWIEKNPGEGMRGVRRPRRVYWCTKHGIRGEERIKYRGHRNGIEQQVQLALMEYDIEPYPPKELNEHEAMPAPVTTKHLLP